MELAFGLFDHLDRRAEPLATTYAERIAFVQAAEAAGFRGYHLAEHHGTPLGMAPSPGLFLAAVAQATRRIRLGPLAYIVPLYDPLRLIEEICMLDHLSGGRLDVGVGRGVNPVEIAFFGVEPAACPALHAEVVDILVAGLSRSRLTHRGERYRYEDVPMVLAPLQRPLPLWSVASSPAGMAYSAARGMHSVSLGSTTRVREATAAYREAWARTADDPRRAQGAATPFVGAYRIVVAAANDAQAERLARPAYRDWFDKLISLWRAHGIAAPMLGPLADFDVARGAGMLVVGSAARVADELGRQIETTAVNYLALQFAFGNLAHADELRSLECFATHVRPALARAAA